VNIPVDRVRVTLVLCGHHEDGSVEIIHHATNRGVVDVGGGEKRIGVLGGGLEAETTLSRTREHQ